MSKDEPGVALLLAKGKKKASKAAMAVNASNASAIPGAGWENDDGTKTNSKCKRETHCVIYKKDNDYWEEDYPIVSEEEREQCNVVKLAK